MTPRSASTAAAAAVAEIRRGGIVVVRDADRHDRGGELVMAADLVAARCVNFMVREGRGLICVVLTPQRCAELGLAMHPSTIAHPARRRFTISIEARVGVGSGISTADRARTLRVAADPSSGPDDLVSPGHVFPIVADPGGVLARPRHAEAALDLVRLAGRRPAAVTCEILDGRGDVAREAELRRFCERHGLPLVAVSDLASYRRRGAERAIASHPEPAMHG